MRISKLWKPGAWCYYNSISYTSKKGRFAIGIYKEKNDPFNRPIFKDNKWHYGFFLKINISRYDLRDQKRWREEHYRKRYCRQYCHLRGFPITPEERKEEG